MSSELCHEIRLSIPVLKEEVGFLLGAATSEPSSRDSARIYEIISRLSGVVADLFEMQVDCSTDASPVIVAALPHACEALIEPASNHPQTERKKDAQKPNTKGGNSFLSQFAVQDEIAIDDGSTAIESNDSRRYNHVQKAEEPKELATYNPESDSRQTDAIADTTTPTRESVVLQFFENANGQPVAPKTLIDALQKAFPDSTRSALQQSVTGILRDLLDSDHYSGRLVTTGATSSRKYTLKPLAVETAQETSSQIEGHTTDEVPPMVEEDLVDAHPEVITWGVEYLSVETDGTEDTENEYPIVDETYDTSDVHDFDEENELVSEDVQPNISDILAKIGLEISDAGNIVTKNHIDLQLTKQAQDIFLAIVGKGSLKYKEVLGIFTGLHNLQVPGHKALNPILSEIKQKCHEHGIVWRDDLIFEDRKKIRIIGLSEGLEGEQDFLA